MVSLSLNRAGIRLSDKHVGWRVTSSPKDFFLRHMRAGHGANDTPYALREAVQRLTAGRIANDLRWVAVDLAACLTPQKLLVTVAAELLGEGAHFGLEFLEGLNHTSGQEGLQTTDPDVLGGTVDKEEGIPKAQFADGVTVDNVQVDLFQVALGRGKCLTVVSLA